MGTTPVCDTASCVFGEWSSFGACSRSCGGGTQLKTRLLVSGDSTVCGPAVETRVCSMQVQTTSSLRVTAVHSWLAAQ
jgi:hypothetical protein